ncbi:hypothetical protein F5Y16DRAFT_402844 [Xylariaceae sp. FL0255]|nr:hypothetical protein F5Y16DRAFT_402844 [Xylariaceae sp. FL0255]
MTFGAYPQRQEESRMSLEQPLLDEFGMTGRTSDEDMEFEKKSSYFSPRGGIPHGRLRRSLVLTIAQGVGMAALVLQSVMLWRLWRQEDHAETLGEVNGVVPSVRTEVRRFEPDPAFDPLNVSDPGWLRVMPLGGGFVSVDNWQGKSLPHPIPSRGKDLYNVAVFHQLHCLHVLAEEFSILLADGEVGSTPAPKQEDIHSGHGHPSHGSPGHEKGVAIIEHIRHCLEYIKTSLTCCADTALEGQTKGSDLPGTDGFGSYHTCRNFDEVFSWAEASSPSAQSGYPASKA